MRQFISLLWLTESTDYEYSSATDTSNTLSPDSQEFAYFEEHYKKDVLKRVRKELEAEIANEAQPLEEKLKSKFVNIVQRCQEAFFVDYKKKWQAGNSSFATP